MDGEEGAHGVGGVAIVNARVWTGDARRRWADAVLVSADRIAIVGSSAEVMKRVTAGTRVIDARGRLVLPVGDRIARGDVASFAMVDGDATRIPPAEADEARVVIRVVGGQLVYEAPGL